MDADAIIEFAERVTIGLASGQELLACAGLVAAKVARLHGMSADRVIGMVREVVLAALHGTETKKEYGKEGGN